MTKQDIKVIQNGDSVAAAKVGQIDGMGGEDAIRMLQSKDGVTLEVQANEFSMEYQGKFGPAGFTGTIKMRQEGYPGVYFLESKNGCITAVRHEEKYNLLTPAKGQSGLKTEINDFPMTDPSDKRANQLINYYQGVNSAIFSNPELSQAIKDVRDAITSKVDGAAAAIDPETIVKKSSDICLS